jgi:Tfp pilus assembly protein PilZ
MKIKLKKSKRYRGYQVGINPEDESLTVEDIEGQQITRLILEDFLDRLGASAHEFKRRYPRLDLGVHVKYYDPDNHLYDGIASTVGGGGLFIEQLHPLTVGTEISLELHLPASRNVIPTKAKVIWVRKGFIQKVSYPGMGLKFIMISDRDRAELMHFVNKFNQQRGFLDL